MASGRAKLTRTLFLTLVEVWDQFYETFARLHRQHCALCNCNYDCNLQLYLESIYKQGAVVVAQLTARSLPIPEYPGSNPVFGNFY